jgi:leucyl/phenylalanyl-tRNA--protein transferase
VGRHRRDLASEALKAEFDRLLAAAVPGEDLVCVGADLRPATLMAAYARGLFPMGLGRHGTGRLGWWSPDPRGVLPLDALCVSRSLRRSVRRFEIRLDTAFDAVLAECAAPNRPGRWITPAIAQAYTSLFDLGIAHSVEAWRDGELVGGLYGVSLGGLFAGESMFHRVCDASKVALVALVGLLGADGAARLLDVQWRTDHLAYLMMLSDALTLPTPSWSPGVVALSLD